MTWSVVIFRLVITLHAAAVAHYGARDVPSEELVLAVIQHESRGDPDACREDQGGASFGLMQPWFPHARCDLDGFAEHSDALEPSMNIMIGINRLVNARRWHRRVCKRRHDFLAHYAGRGPAADRAAREIRRMERYIKRKGLGSWRTATAE